MSFSYVTSASSIANKHEVQFVKQYLLYILLGVQQLTSAIKKHEHFWLWCISPLRVANYVAKSPVVSTS